jgi:hypothetical protein
MQRKKLPQAAILNWRLRRRAGDVYQPFEYVGELLDATTGKKLYASKGFPSKDEALSIARVRAIERGITIKEQD